jgi:hypothetical protein
MQAPCVLGLTLLILLLGSIKRVPVQAVQLPLVLDIRHEKLPEAEPEVQRRADNGPIFETIDNDVSETRRKDQIEKSTEPLLRIAFMVLCEYHHRHPGPDPKTED